MGRMSGLGGCIVGAKHGRQNLGRSPREYLRPCFARTQNGGIRPCFARTQNGGIDLP